MLLGSKQKKEIKKLIKQSDFLVLPSFSEGYGLVCAEAMASGTPVIMSKTGCAGELVINNKTGIIIPPGKQRALEKQLD